MRNIHAVGGLRHRIPGIFGRLLRGRPGLHAEERRTNSVLTNFYTSPVGVNESGRTMSSRQAGAEPGREHGHHHRRRPRRLQIRHEVRIRGGLQLGTTTDTQEPLRNGLLYDQRIGAAQVAR